MSRMLYVRPSDLVKQAREYDVANGADGSRFNEGRKFLWHFFESFYGWSYDEIKEVFGDDECALWEGQKDPSL